MIKIIRRIATIIIEMSAFLSAWILTVLILSFCSSLPASSIPAVDTYARQKEAASCQPGFVVELDIFSGNPNPAWVLSEADGVIFQKKLAMLPRASAKGLFDNLGYRGFIVRVINETEERFFRIQNGTVQLSQNGTNFYYFDQNRHLERWLLDSGKSALRGDLFKMVERDFPKDSTTLSYPLE